MRLEIMVLPGMDGTGILLKNFIRQLPQEISVTIVYYPHDTYQTYEQLAENVRSIVPVTRPYVVIAESYSGPVASLLSENPIGNLRAVIFASSFVSLPWGRIGTWIAKILPAVLFRLRPPAWALRWFLMTSATSAETIVEVQDIIARISPEVMVKRLKDALTADFSIALQKSTIRTVCLVPESDRLIGARGYQSLREAKKDIEAVKIAGPHFLLQCSPEACSDALQKLGLFDVGTETFKDRQ